MPSALIRAAGYAGAFVLFSTIALSAQESVRHPPGGYVQANRARLWYESEGKGEPLILIAGGPGSSHNYFHPFFSRLADSFQVVYFDGYGRGRSQRAQSPAEYTFERDVRDLEALRRELGLERCTCWATPTGVWSQWRTRWSIHSPSAP